MASLTGSTVAESYLGLIKTNDNAVINGTHRALTDGDGNAIGIQVKTSGAPRFPSGILFGSDTAAANTLDDYEEGTFTPALRFGGDGTGITYASAQGYYTKIGDLVMCQIYVELTNKGSATGSATIINLPFSSVNTVSVQSASVGFNDLATTDVLSAAVLGSASSINLYDGSANATNADFANNSSISISIIFKTA